MSNRKILIIDDDIVHVKMVKAFLSAHGFDVISANDGEEGLAVAAAENPDLIILDVQMPKMNGYTFIFELNKVVLARNIPIVVLTGKNGMAEIFKAEGVVEYLDKPLQPELLLTTIKKYV